MYMLIIYYHLIKYAYGLLLCLSGCHVPRAGESGVVEAPKVTLSLRFFKKDDGHAAGTARTRKKKQPEAPAVPSAEEARLREARIQQDLMLAQGGVSPLQTPVWAGRPFQALEPAAGSSEEPPPGRRKSAGTGSALGRSDLVTGQQALCAAAPRKQALWGLEAGKKKEAPEWKVSRNFWNLFILVRKGFRNSGKL
jgi:hypothetical protein